jgi:hypothetical protein
MQNLTRAGDNMFGKIASAGGLVGLLAALAGAAPDEPDRMSRDKAALAPLQAYVGQWRGVGMPKRGSNRGAWTETCQWAWQFRDGRAALVGIVEGGKFYRQFRVQPGDKPGQFVLAASAADGAQAPERFVGELVDGALLVTAAEARAERPARISVRLVAGGDRLVVLYEKRAGEDTYARLAEVGATRKGSSFAQNAATGPECVVTGGLGEIAVEHNGKTYYVCCTGCRDLFLEDPEGVLTEYRQRKAAEKAKRDE